jgi:PAS domain S-box-containing protein
VLVGAEEQASKKPFWARDVACTAVVLGALAWLGGYNYLTFHSLAELFSIIVAAAIFVIAWNVRDTIDNGYLQFLGIALLFVAAVDLAHMLAYSGMGVFPGYGSDLATQLWVAGRALEALSLLIAPLFLSRRPRPLAIFVPYAVVTTLLLFSAFVWRTFPVCYVEGRGLTQFKIFAEYLICVILILALGVLLANRSRFQKSILLLLCGAVLTRILSELAFTRYASVYGNFNMIGHLLKIVSVIFIYKAIVETGFRRPYELLYRSMAESERKFRSAIESNVIGVVFADPITGDVTEANDEFLRIVGRTKPELQAGTLNWKAMTPPETLAWEETAIKSHDSGKKNIGSFEKEYMRPDGTRVPVIIGGALLDDRKHRMVAYVLDNTARKEAEEEIRRAREELEQKVLVRTEELRRVNRTLRMISECNEILVRAQNEQALMQDICRVIVEVGGYRMAWVGYAQEDDEKTVVPVASMGFQKGALESYRISWGEDARGRGPIGTSIRTSEICTGGNYLEDPDLAPWREEALKHGFVSSIVLPLKTSGRTFGTIAIYAQEPYAFDKGSNLMRELAEDLAFGIRSIRMQAERDRARQIAETRAGQLRALAAELVQAEQKERRQLARILHDHLQQLLVAAKMNAAMIRSKSGTTVVQDLADRLTETLDQSILASRSLTADLSPPVLHEKGLAAGLEWLGRQMHEKHGLTLDVSADAAAEPGDDQVRTFLFDAVRELLLNIVKHAGVDRAQVQMRPRDRDEIEVVVADEGAGFDPMRIETAHSITGGFGLFSIRERLSHLGGRMQIDAAPGQGSRFTLVAPARLAQQSARSDAFAADAPPADPKIRVLIADDHIVVRQGLLKLLEEQPDIHVIGDAGKGYEAVEMARRLKPDVVLMDISLPDMSGLDATRLILSSCPEVSVIGLSMHEEEDMAASMLEAGAVAYLTKGGATGPLISTIRASVTSKAQSLECGSPLPPFAVSLDKP